MNLMKVAAIVPAYNEAGNVGNVLKILLSSPELNEVILVDDGSIDNTSQIGRDLGAKVITLNPNMGKGGAMIKAVESTDAQIVVFFDADLINLKTEHIPRLLYPIKNGNASMCVGIRGRLGGWPKMLSKIAPITCVIGGERAMKREVFLGVPKKFVKGFSVEIALNNFCKVNKLKIMLTELSGLDIITKEKKWGLWKGLRNRVKMIWQLIKIRTMVFAASDEFRVKVKNI